MNELFFLLFFSALLYLLARGYIRIAKRLRWVNRNYKGKFIPVGIGVTIPLASLFPLLIYREEGVFSFLFPLYILAVIGWVDDLWGEQRVKGIGGHIHLLLEQKKISSALLKAAAAFFSGLLTLLSLTNRSYWPIGLLGYLLLVHLINLLDVRPLRALKGFWLLFFLFFLFVDQLMVPFSLIFLWIGTLVIAIFDRNERAMLGDAGSNFLGGILGYLLLTSENVALWLFTVFLGSALTLYAEVSSFSHFIESNKLLRKLDRLGRI